MKLEKINRNKLTTLKLNPKPDILHRKYASQQKKWNMVMDNISARLDESANRSTNRLRSTIHSVVPTSRMKISELAHLDDKTQTQEDDY